MNFQESAFLETINFSKWYVIENNQFLLMFKEKDT